MKRTVEITKNSFFEIFSDAITLYELSAAEQKPHIKNILAKSSLLSINYALEAAANSFLSSIEVTQKLKSQFDRFSTLDKFDFTLQWHKETSLPRGVIQTQIIKELIDQRNALVHPKVTSIMDVIETTSGEDKLAYLHQSTSDPESPKSKLSNISLVPERYTDKDALIALKALVNFLNSYVNDWWGIDLETSAILLMPSWNGSIQAKPILYERNSLETVLRHDHHLEIKFLGLHGIFEQFA
ncbi:hypothetical protein I2494_12605 [Budviciaceae bacterium BWR-B9]|uniref:RiboL-PSP-HEPN domain-containing protein n=1 Tax=Limnobaculum allomyrinae TaxID=2791986 RepID=A0ABS1IS13_9GAMM|nr:MULTISPECIES: hypothetical protein [Limnobaculum]MBK5144547.1 hypothetical protein [Limnobaculum allomyrinae]MBV7692224.1 hypothetical protein [Limnobaculum sp. M2-1]